MKIGLFFGSFNPIHVGHLIMASHMVQHTNLDKIWFVVTPQNPHKTKDSLLDDRQRLHLVRLAIEDNINFEASDIEFHLPQPNYTVNTLVHLREKYPDKQFALIMGEDNLCTLHKWKNYEEILKHHQIVVYPRMQEDNTKEPKEEVMNSGQIVECEAPVIKISASYVRDLISAGLSAEYVLPPAVLQYVEEMHFYEK